ncbi:hypothetical protein TSUD_411320 [Trifolium subterraneum]|uniref:Reverse transcriptase zinc-binding domain-containing protein n=1 Tax=Trifolium subterraneum TaxID=3900 RepID=A0A2Z6PK27_TRISU|nr:hypothetical protein TSUD_411320 [Trifolium subterraneum]
MKIGSLQLYGIPLHAWNMDFFKLCVRDCGRFLRVDEGTLERDMFDYARVLVATSSVEVLNSTTNILVDEVLVEIKLLEEWGSNLGEDACLAEEEDKQDQMSEHADEIASVEDDLHVNPDKSLGDAGIKEFCGGTQVEPSVRREDTNHAPINNVTETNVLSRSVEMGKSRRRHSSCHPSKGGSVMSGLWSLEWFHEHIHSGAGIIFSPKKQTSKHENQPKVADRESKRKKFGGVLCHTMQTLKKVARLPGKERREVLKILKKEVRKRSGRSRTNKSVTGVQQKSSGSVDSSMASINKDWENWVVMHGDEKVAVEDVREEQNPSYKIQKQNGGRLQPPKLASSDQHQQKRFRKQNAARLQRPRLATGDQEKRVGSKSSFTRVSKPSSLSKRGRGLKKVDVSVVGEEAKATGEVERGRVLRGVLGVHYEDHIVECERTGWAGEKEGVPGYSFRPSVGASGGILVMWDTEEVEVWSTVSHPHILIIHGRFIRAQEEFFLFNVYAPCENNAKLELWDRLTGRLLQLGRQKVCICGNFNAVRSDAERRYVNFHKSMLIGVNVDESWLAESATVLGCSVGRVPFMYFGLPIGGDPSRVSFWEPVVNRIQSRLTIWKSRFLSFDGRLVLLKSVLTSLPVYALSFFKALSGKWCWQMLVDKYGLWYRTLAAWMSTVAEMIALGWGGGCETWLWQRQLWAWEEEMVEECRALLADVELKDNITYYWVWRPDPSAGYSVRGAYDLLTSRGAQVVTATTDLIWHKQVPLKVSMAAWLLLRNRLPTKDNLVRRHIIPQGAHLCVAECGVSETAQHLFLSCPAFAPLWDLVRSWVGISAVDPSQLHDHFVQFTHSTGSLLTRRSFLQLLWLCTIWVLWHERNSRIFKTKEIAVHQMLDKVKAHALWWMKAYNVNLGLNSHMWWSSPFVCLGIG